MLTKITITLFLSMTCFVAGESISVEPATTHQSPITNHQKTNSALAYLKGARASGRLSKIAGTDSIDVSIRFVREPSESILSELEDRGVGFYRMDGEILHVGRIYGARISWAALPALEENEAVERIESCWHPKVVSPLDVSGPEIQADQVWNLSARPPALTGQGVRIAMFDTGVDVFHPTFWRADGEPVHWMDKNDNARFDNGVDGVDTDGDGVFDLDEVLRFWDTEIVDHHYQFSPIPGVFEADLDWLYNDRNRNGRRDFGPEAGFTGSDPTFGEPMYGIVDGNGNNALDPGEKLIPLHTCKIVASLENNGIERRGGGLLYDRGDGVNHGTCSCGIAAGGASLGRRLVGIAPGAELLVANRANLSPEWYIPWARKLGADIMVYEFGTWLFEFMDGSSNLEQMIAALAREGIVQLTASGNLAGPKRKKHCRTEVPAGGSRSIRINIPRDIGVRQIYLTALWILGKWESEKVRDTPSLAFRMISPSGKIMHLAGTGEPTKTDDVEAFSQYEISSRGTSKMDIVLYRENGADGVWTLVAENRGESDQRMDGFVTDDVTDWVDGAQFLDFVTDDGTVTWPGTADEAITVAAYDPRGTRNTKGAINDFSGWGKRIDGAPLVDLAAPGSIVYTAQSHYVGKKTLGGYGPFEGTSSALPHVAGAAALLLQADPTLTHDGVRRALTEGALRDAFTGAVPNDRWGYGKLRILDALSKTGFASNTPPLISATTLLPDTDDERHSYEVTACVQDADSVAQAALFFSADSVHFEEVPMQPHHGITQKPTESLRDIPCCSVVDSSLDPQFFRAAIPARTLGTKIWYYVRAVDRKGAVSTDPPGAPKRTFSFTVVEGHPLFECVSSVVEGKADGSDRVAAWGDYDGDGFPDLFVVREGGPDRLYHNEGNGAFAEVAEKLGVADEGRGRWAAWGDYDLDGDPDLFAVRDGQTNLLYRNDGTRFVAGSWGCEGFPWRRGRMAVWGDYDGDGFPDLYVVNTGQTNSLYRNLGDGHFEDVSSASGTDDRGRGTAAAWGDFDLDGNLDLYVVNEGSANVLYRNQGDGTFSNGASEMDVADSGPGRHAIWGDFDLDGDPDLYVVNDRTDNLLFVNRPDSAFAERGWRMGIALAGPDRSATAADVDNDGDLDLYAVEEGQPDVLYRNEDGGFIHNPFGATEDTGPGIYAAFADYDLDGGLDFVLLKAGAPNRLYRNVHAEQHFIGIKLWKGIGARIRVTAGGSTQTRRVVADNGLPIHFGLGSNNEVRQIEIAWPSGRIQSLRFLPADQHLLIPEDVKIKTFVWPGDCDNDGTVDAADLFPIEAHWHTDGPPRIGAGSLWIGRGAALWNPPNAVFADANGDGIVDERDIASIAKNWGRMHPTVRGRPTVRADVTEAYLHLYKNMQPIASKTMKAFVRDQLERLGIPFQIALTNFPNPFDKETTFRLDVPPEADRVCLQIYNVTGQRIRTLLHEDHTPGRIAISWDGRDAYGRRGASGVYLCRLDIGESRVVRKIMLLR
ncbi:MAG: VCBS repeat-containing protein [Candidatus Latescibacteria bacterium]|nr:VCBS repeat-containing protein [Candidatus Latescibacterota bacterium]